MRAPNENVRDTPERHVFFEQFATGYEALRANAGAWTEIEAERAVEAGVLRDSSAGPPLI